MRENYDLIYPYITPEGKIPLQDVTSEMIYNYDICAKSIVRDTGKGILTEDLPQIFDKFFSHKRLNDI